jgi:hypothetical protein
MNHWTDLSKKLVLGTDKLSLEPSVLPPDLESAYSSLKDNTDKEDLTMQLSFLLWNYAEGGKVFPTTKKIFTEAAPETQPVISKEKELLLQSILTHQLDDLLLIFLNRCADNKEILPPHILPTIFNKSKTLLEIREPVLKVVGERGKWLLSQNDLWNSTLNKEPQEIWETGKMVERLAVLQEIRKSEPKKSIEWLQLAWNQETAANRLILLEELENNTNEGDISFLEEVLKNDRSEKVKKLSLDFLAKIDSSGCEQKLYDLFHPNFEKDKKGIFKINVPETLSVELRNIGILDLSYRGFTQEESWVFQILSLIKPVRWTKKFATTSKILLEQLSKNKATSKYYKALINSAILHRDVIWSKEILNYEANQKKPDLDKDDFNQLFKQISIEDKQKFFYSKLYSHLGSGINLLVFAINCDFPWSLKFTEDMFAALSLQYKSIYYDRDSIYLLHKFAHSGILTKLDQLGDLRYEDNFNKLLQAMELGSQLAS